MPIDKQPNGSTNKPVTPALSSRFRTTKAPFAPRLAGSTPTSPIVQSPKPLRDQTFSPPTQQSRVQNLSDNVTPRSSARTTRVSSESPTSPVSNRRWSGSSSFVQAILPSARPTTTAKGTENISLNQARPAFKTNSPSTSATRRLSGSSHISKKDEETTKFIRANDAKPTSSFQSPKSTLSPRPLSTALGKNGSPRVVNSAPPSAIHTSTNERKDQNVLRANGVPLRNGRPPALVRKQSTTSTTSTKTTRNGPPEPARVQSNPPQPPLRKQPSFRASPVKAPSTFSATPTTKQQTSTQPSSLITSPPSPSARRPSFGSNVSNPYPVRPMLHRKSASVSSLRPPSPKFMISPLNKALSQMESVWISPSIAIPSPRSNLAIPSPDTISPRSASLASSKTVGTSVTSDTDASEVSKAGLPYPTITHIEANQSHQAQPSPLAQAQANAANARRERKVLDLEISNSSLLAINKTLEKELRKQSAELRRFRRLSRSGRLSFAPSNRSVSGASAISLDTLQEQTEDDDDFSDGEDEESDIDGFDEDANDDDLEASSSGVTARTRQRARDERRLMLDLSKHQQLLVDSQKLSQSIRKCLSISEDLIKQGNQALKYKVGIGDIKIGGRVLSAEDFDMDNDADVPQKQQEKSSQGLLSPSIGLMELREEDLWQNHGQRQTKFIDPFTDEFPDPD